MSHNLAGVKRVVIDFIPQSEQRYDTSGDWFVDSDGTMQIKVSQTQDPRHQHLVAIHELVEATLCTNDGITQEQVDQFDMFDGAHLNEPGDSPHAPYHLQHVTASYFEEALAGCLHVNYDDYDAAVSDRGVVVNEIEPVA